MEPRTSTPTSSRTSHALLLYVDIVKFSERRPNDQVRMMRHLLDIVRRSALFAELADPYLNSTGDGLIAAFPADGDDERVLRLFELAGELVTRAKECEDERHVPMQIRMGLHLGSLRRNVAGDDLASFAVGNGLNWVTRVGDAAADSQVLVSEELVQDTWNRLGFETVADRFFPRPETAPSAQGEPFSIRVKHDRSARVRILVGDGLSMEVPPRLRRTEAIGEHVANALQIVGDALVAGLKRDGESPKRAAARLTPRLTVWRPEGSELRAVSPRIELPRVSGVATAPTRTTWALPVADAAPAGPVAEAFARGKVVCALGFPHPERRRRAYFARWRQMGVPEDVVAGFSRKARAILVVPLKLFDRPAGVACVDFAADLAGLEPLVLRLGDQVVFRSGYLLAALLQLQAA